ncbi:MAG: acetolactate synthase large subunit [Acidobacteriota bacterium]|jgi:acetolactate synthase-1/2/3 large subunit|nr:acetolactate synthase large subunit [Acidobacteriota bacterium]
MKVKDYVARFLAEQGVSCVFELPGGMSAHFIDSLCQQGRVRIVSVHHEQSAAFAADAVGRLTGVPGVAFATSGPGATNLLTGIGSCHFDSSPAVFITGQVNRSELKGDRAIRQLGFQETDIVSMVRPITKAAWQVRTPEEIPELLRKAFALATSGRPGPVLLDIPMDVQSSGVSDAVAPEGDAPGSAGRDDIIDEAVLRELFAQLGKARRPLVLVGGGVRAARATDLLRSFVEKIGVPVVNSLMAVDVIPHGNPLRVGMIGTYGNRWANLAIGRSDFILVLGSRLDIRQTGADTKSFKSDRNIFHVDCEAEEMNNRVPGCHAVVADLSGFLKAALSYGDDGAFAERAEWLDEIADLRSTWPDTRELLEISGVNPNALMHQLSAVSSRAAAYVVDVGLHQMWAAQSLDLNADQQFLTSGGMGAMGFALPASIGAAVAVAPRSVVVIAGDGGFQLNIQELQTVVRNRLPIKIVVMNNQSQGMIRQFQQTYFDGRYQSSVWGYSTPDFARVAEAYGIAGRTLEDENESEEALRWLWQEPTEPALLQVMIDIKANAYPKIAFGKPLTEMEPFAEPVGLEST